ncbi:MAG TPA: hypothetical protein VJT50_09815 [Pyrinomonadaceae bacterium]|nr:hypothetical protein [Pyrinomonadaceae bacterium]
MDSKLRLAAVTSLTNETLARAAKTLARRDKDLAAILKRYGPPPLWQRKAGFTTLVQIILEQQVSLSSAAAIFNRMSTGIVPFNPSRMLSLGESHLKSLGLTRQKTAYCIHLSQLLHENRLNLSQLRRLNDEAAKAKLMQVKGIGSWSADIYLLMALLRPDIWPAGDLALAIAIKQVRNLKQPPAPREMAKIADAWRPFRSVAARMLWQHYLAEQRNWRADSRRAKELLGNS